MPDSEPTYIDNMSLKFIANELRTHDLDYYQKNVDDVIYRLQDALRPHGDHGMRIWMNSKSIHPYTLAEYLERLLKT